MSVGLKLNGLAGVFFAVMVLVSLNVNASTAKAYKGEALPADQLAVVYPDKQKTGPMAYQTVQIYQVDDVVVGGVLKGWPKQVEIPGGEHKITFRFFNSNQGSKTTGEGVVGAAFGGAVLGGIKAKQNQNEKKTLTFTCTAGHEYVFKFAPLFTPDRFWIEDKADGSVAGEYKPDNETDLKSLFDKK